jgi:hypothetical protein
MIIVCTPHLSTHHLRSLLPLPVVWLLPMSPY